MVFSSFVFIFQFLPIVILLYFLAPGIRLKNIVLLVTSLLFYAWGEPIWVSLLLISGIVDYTNGRIIDKYRGTYKSKLALIASIVINLSLLGTFKYGNFIIDNVNALLGLNMDSLNATLPIGISFYTFQTLSYTIDVYRGRVKVQKSFIDFQLFVALFPQLIAGPIVRYSDIEHQLKYRSHANLESIAGGITRFLTGLAKKVLIANYAGAVATDLLGSNLSNLTVLDGWIGILMFTFQIYFDFSGYSDMAIGLGKIFGFDYCENFNYPYISRSITEFWRRWHISLGSFFRDYVYIPLGGNRKYLLRNILVVWILTGLWHGSSWNFVIWGLYFGILLLFEKFWLKDFLNKIPAPISWLYSMFFVVIGWGIFYFVEIESMIEFFQLIFGFSENAMFSSESIQLLIEKSYLIILATIASTPIGKKFADHLSSMKMGTAFNIGFNLTVLLLCMISLSGSTFNPFLYFRF